jgi:tyrosyl-tRNA synthetase
MHGTHKIPARAPSHAFLPPAQVFRTLADSICMDHLTASATVQLPEGEADRMLGSGRPLRIKFGMDPTAPDLHLGHMAMLQRLRAFQDCGHTVVLIVGDFTARIGDPTGRSKARPPLSATQVEANAKTFCDQAFLVLDPQRTELRFNSQWLGELGSEGMLRLLGQATVAQLLERRDFAERIKRGQALSVVELAYPLLQGLDSVHVNADIEVGGDDQLFNLLMGRDMQAAAGTVQQAVLCWPLLAGTDGSAKMSKSANNHVPLVGDVADQFGRIMSVSDELMGEWARLLMVTGPAGAALAEEVKAGLHPMQAKRHLARTLICRLHGDEAAAQAEAAFDSVFARQQQPEQIDELALSELEVGEHGRVFLPALVHAHMGEASRASARRLIAGGGLRVNEQPHRDLEIEAERLQGALLRIGRRRWLQIV